MQCGMKKRVCALMMALVLAMPALAGLAEAFPYVGFAAVSVNVRTRPSDTAPVATVVPATDAMTVTGESGDYYIVQYEGTEGYVLKKYVSFTGGAESAEMATVPPSTSTAGFMLLYSGSRGTEVKILQQALKELGFLSGEADGVFGAATKKAVIAFQKQNGLEQTGTADADTQDLLFLGKPKNSHGKAVKIKTVSPLAGAVISSGSQGEAVRLLQVRLKELGYYTGTPDSVCGSATMKAIKAFQKKMGLSQTGKADGATQTALYGDGALSVKATATPKPTPTPTPIPTNKPAATAEPTFPFTTYTLAAVNLRKTASLSGARIMTISKGEEIAVLAVDGEFAKVSYKNKTGFVAAEYVNIPAQYLPGKTLQEDSDAQASYGILQSGSRSKAVAALQEALKELGYYAGTADGSFGMTTVAAFKKFQKINGLKQDGIASAEIQKLIFEGRPLNSRGKKTTVKTLPAIENFPMALGKKGEAVTRLQERLRSLGYYTAEATATYDSATEKAVRKFQSEHNLTVDGKAGTKTLRLLNALTATQAPAVTATPAPYVSPTPTPITAQNVVVMYKGTQGLAVKRLQERLTALGYYACDADSRYDEDDMEAVRAFQRKNGLKIDGIAGLETQQLLFSDRALPATNVALPTPTPVPTPAPLPTDSGWITVNPGAATATPYPFYTPDLTETIGAGSTGEGVRALQERLTVLGYYKTGVDGIFGNATQNAIVAFQRRNGLTVSGEANPATLKRLYSDEALSASGGTVTATPAPAASATPAPAILKAGSKGDQVKAMQQRLVALGYLSAADGIYGPRTYNAVVAFQRKNGLTADGVVGGMTLNRLHSSSAVSANGSTGAAAAPTPTLSNNGNSGGFVAPRADQVRFANYYTEIRARAKLMPDVVIYDPDTGLHYNLHMFSFGKHVDSEPPTVEDTEIMYQVCGVNSWTPKYVWVIFSDGRVYLGSTHSHGHEVDHTNGNNLTGHICVHFPRVMSEAEATGPYAVSHQKEILWGWEMTQAMIK